eukprot:c8540_g1_i1.p1 GENE.c8540_g1_i1~~c8540_g1_i1.p1  ORF type:complete len:450 (-),score=128.13 c8540_g1_i1:239-1588(-)
MRAWCALLFASLVVALPTQEKNNDKLCYADKDWGPPMYRGVVIYLGASDRQNLSESIARHSCNGGNWIELTVPCSQGSLTNATSLACADNIEQLVAEDVELIRCVDPKMSIFLSPYPSYNTETSWQANIGESNFNDEKFWDDWFGIWKREMTRFAKVAQHNHVEMLGIGLELSTPQLKSNRWRDLVNTAVRPHFQGTIIYGSDKYSEKDVEFWDTIDAIGVDGYYRLAKEDPNPSLATLKSSWKEWVQNLQNIQSKYPNKPVIFTELGYRSLQGTNRCPGCWTMQGDTSLELQARLFESLFEAVCTQKFFGGIFVFGWSVDVQSDLKNAINNGYSVIGKPAEDVLATWFRASTRFNSTEGVSDCRKHAAGVGSQCVAKMHAMFSHHHNVVLIDKSSATTTTTTMAAAVATSASLSSPIKLEAGIAKPVINGKNVKEQQQPKQLQALQAA